MSIVRFSFNKLYFLSLLLLPFVSIGQSRNISGEAKLKFDDALEIINRAYVDTVDNNKLVEDAIKGMLKDLDPHSEYMDEKTYKEMNEPLAGNFEGIGVQFNLIKDTIVVISPISGGPSEKLGIRSGDKIVTIEGKVVAGVGFTTNDVIKNLRGEKGTKVNVGIQRNGVSDLIKYTIVRDKIPIYSVDASYMLTPEIGYLKLSRFAASSMNEFKEATAKLKEQKVKHFVLDLRGNSGGYLNTAIEIADEFLKDKQLVVYTQGNSSPRKDYNATSKGEFLKGKVVVLIDEGSASASEIVSGAIQDWDRGLIIGRRSFGKGLVQNPYRLRDGSTLKLTTSRYHTPTGRCIQKSYDEGVEEYAKDRKKRYDGGEYFNKDSIHLNDSLKFFTPNKRVVYGGGGIMPDIFIPFDTTENSEYFTALFIKNIFNEFVLRYMNANEAEFDKTYPNLQTYIKNFEVTEQIMNDFLALADAEGAGVPDTMKTVEGKGKDAVKEALPKEEIDKLMKEAAEKKAKGLELSGKAIRIQIKALIARNKWQTSAFFEVFNKTNPVVLKAIEVIENNTFKDMKINAY